MNRSPVPSAEKIHDVLRNFFDDPHSRLHESSPCTPTTMKYIVSETKRRLSLMIRNYGITGTDEEIIEAYTTRKQNY